MKIALVRGDFAAPGEFPNFLPLTKKHSVTLFTGLKPVWELGDVKGMRVKKLLSPVDLNFGKVNRFVMGATNRLFTDAHVLFGLEEKLKGFDVAHCAETYYSYTQQCITAKEKGYVKKVVATVWENIAHNNEGIAGRKEFKQRAFAKVDKFLAVTKRAKDVLIEEGCPHAKIEVLMPGVDLDFFKRRGLGESQEFSKKGIDKRKIKLLFSGRLIPEKGIGELLEMFAKMHETLPQSQLVVAGEGPLREELELRTKNYGLSQDIIFLGRINYFEMPKIYSLCDLLLHFPLGSKTWQEQYGMALIEALACGLPVLGLDQGSVKEVVGIGGVVVAKAKFAKELGELTKSRSKLKSLSEKAREFAEKNYDSRNYAKRLEEVYEL